MFSPGRAPYNFSFLWAVNNARYTPGTTGLTLFPTHGFPAARRLFSLTRRMAYIHPRLAFTRFHLFIRRRKLRCARCCSGAPASLSSLLFPRHQLLFFRFFFIFLSPKRETWLRAVFPRPCILRLWVSPFRPNRETLASSTLKLRRAICARTCLAFASSQEQEQQRLVRARTSGIEASLLARRGRGYVFLSARDTPFEEAGCTQRCFS